MVAHGHRVESVLEPGESVFGMRTPVHEIPNSEESIAPRVELDRRESALERVEATVDIADHEVTTGLVVADEMRQGHRGVTGTTKRERRSPPRPP